MKQNFLYPPLAALISGVAVAVFSYVLLAPREDAAQIEFARQSIAVTNTAGVAAVREFVRSASPSADLSDAITEFLGRERFSDYIVQTYTLRNTGSRIYPVSVRLSGLMIAVVNYEGKEEVIREDRVLSLNIVPESDIAILGIGGGNVYPDGDFFGGGEVAAYHDNSLIPLIDLKIDSSGLLLAVSYVISQYPFLAFLFFVLAFMVWVIVPIALVAEWLFGKNMKYQAKNTRDRDLVKNFMILRYIKDNDQARIEKIYRLIQTAQKTWPKE